MIRPATIPAQEGNENKRASWKTDQCCVICYSCYAMGHYFVGTTLSDITHKAVRILSRPTTRLSANHHSNTPLPLRARPKSGPATHKTKQPLNTLGILKLPWRRVRKT